MLGPMRFIAFEGLDGSGKTTLIQGIANALKHNGVPFCITREPGGTKLGEDLRHFLLKTDGEVPTPRTELLLYEAIRSQHVDTFIRPQLKKGQWILCDRFIASSLAFQAAGRNLNEKDVSWLNMFATHNLIPDLTILLKLDPKQCKKRRQNRKEDRFEKENFSFHQKILESYEKQAKENKDSWFVINAELPKETVLSTVLKEFERRKWIPF